MPRRFTRRTRSRRPRRRRRRPSRRTLVRAFRPLMVPVERKIINAVISGVIEADATPVVSLVLNSCPQGTSEFERIGFKNTCVSLRFLLTVRNNSGGNTPNVRILVVHDKQSDGQLLGIGDVLENTMINVDALIPIQSGRNIQAARRCRVLMDRRLTFTLARNTISIRKFFRFRITTRWSAPAGGFANIESGALYVFMLSDIVMGAGPPGFSLDSRVRFVG